MKMLNFYAFTFILYIKDLLTYLLSILYRRYNEIYEQFRLFVQHACPQSLPAAAAGGLSWRLLTLHWMQNRPTSWLTGNGMTVDQKQILGTD